MAETDRAEGPGIGGLFERVFAPWVMRAIYADEIKRLDARAREDRSA